MLAASKRKARRGRLVAEVPIVLACCLSVAILLVESGRAAWVPLVLGMMLLVWGLSRCAIPRQT